MTTIEQYLQGLFAFQFSDANMTSVLLKRGITAGVDQADVADKDKELAQADLYMVMFNFFGQAGESVSKGNWKRSTGAIQAGIGDREQFMKAANALYKKWGELSSATYGIKDGTNLW